MLEQAPVMANSRDKKSAKVIYQVYRYGVTKMESVIWSESSEAWSAPLVLEKLSLHRTQSSFKQFHTLYIVLNSSFIQFRAVILLYFYAVLRCVQHDIDPGGSVHRCHHHRQLLGQTTSWPRWEKRKPSFLLLLSLLLFLLLSSLFLGGRGVSSLSSILFMIKLTTKLLPPHKVITKGHVGKIPKFLIVFHFESVPRIQYSALIW